MGFGVNWHEICHARVASAWKDHRRQKAGLRDRWEGGLRRQGLIADFLDSIVTAVIILDQSHLKR